MYDEIREIAAFNKRYSGKVAVIAQVLARQFSDESHFFLIDRGVQAGLEVDMVVVYKNCLIGRVVAVYPWYSKVLLITDRLCKVPAISVNHKARGIYMGANSLTMSVFAYVSHLEKLDQGELLVSSGEGLIFPQGFGLGIIKSFDVNNADYTYTTSIEPLIDLKTIDYCSVLKKGTEYLEEVTTAP
jgi:rod shape-determining protein MreC